LPKKYLVYRDGKQVNWEAYTAEELTGFLNLVPHGITYEVKTYEELTFTPRSIGAAAWGNKEQVDQFIDTIESWDEHRIDGLD